MKPNWTCSSPHCDYVGSALVERYCPWCGQDLEPLCTECGGSLLLHRPCGERGSDGRAGGAPPSQQND
ncbi:MAG: hypothetical protein AAF682_14295 [Planctomycetota bacterium]